MCACVRPKVRANDSIYLVYIGNSVKKRKYEQIYVYFKIPVTIHIQRIISFSMIDSLTAVGILTPCGDCSLSSVYQRKALRIVVYTLSFTSAISAVYS